MASINAGPGRGDDMDVVAGWYPDPESGEPEQLRYWDGERWTEHRYQEGSTASVLPEGEWPEGWYPDPESEEPNHLRYWDGTAWTEHRAEEGEET